MENGFYMLKFSLQEDRDKVLELGPWNIFNKPFILTMWSTGCKFDKEGISSVPIWAKLTKLPKELLTNTAISRISNVIGKPLFMDEATTTRSRISFARMCIEVHVNDNFPTNGKWGNNLGGDGIQLEAFRLWKMKQMGSPKGILQSKKFT